MRALLILALLAACAPTPTTPEQVCEQESYRDPAVHDLMVKGAGVEEFRQMHTEELKQARARAIRRCLSGRGLIPAGGVEPRRPTT